MKKYQKWVIGAALIGVLGYGFYDRKNICYTITRPYSIGYAIGRGVDISLQRRLDNEGYDIFKNIPLFMDINSSDLYFLKNLSKIDYTDLINREKLENNLIERLSKKEHTYRKFEDYQIDAELTYSESYEQIEKCNIVQLLKLYVMLNSLENKEISNGIGELIRSDLRDDNHEHGGLVKLKNLSLVFKNYPSDMEGNEVYNPPRDCQEESYKGCFADYHLHAVSGEDTDYAGPSYVDLRSYTIEQIINEGYLGIVITKLKGKEFNIDVWFNDYTEEDSHIIIDLGNYSY